MVLTCDKIGLHRRSELRRVKGTLKARLCIPWGVTLELTLAAYSAGGRTVTSVLRAPALSACLPLDSTSLARLNAEGLDVRCLFKEPHESKGILSLPMVSMRPTTSSLRVSAREGHQPGISQIAEKDVLPSTPTEESEPIAMKSQNTLGSYGPSATQTHLEVNSPSPGNSQPDTTCVSKVSLSLQISS